MDRVWGWVRRCQIEILVAVAILAVCGTIFHDWTAQPASRYLLTVAAVDDNSLELDPYVGLLGLDRAEYRGHTYSDKAPYQPLLGAPAYAVYRLVGGDQFPVVDGVVPIGSGRWTGLWWVTVWTATIPAIVLALAVRRLLSRHHPRLALRVALAMAFATTILPFSSWLFGHVLGAMAVALAWMLLRPPDADHRAVFVGGLCLGLAIGTEFPLALLALIFLVDIVVRRRWSAAAWLSAGTVVATLPLLLYNFLVFESPFETAYQGHLPNFQGAGALGVYNLELPSGEELFKALVGERGLFVLTPVMLVAVLACVWLIVRGGSPLRRDGLIGMAAFVGMVIISTGIDGYGGSSPGPRYLIPMYPLLAVPLAEAWERREVLVTACAVVGAAFMWLATSTDPYVDTNERDALGLWISWLGDGYVAQNIFTAGRSRWVLALCTVTAVLAVVTALRLDARGAAEPRPEAA